ncbi:MAG: hypothetical protein ACLQVD_21645, partial [Capsulimonadaceae bacterium]
SMRKFVCETYHCSTERMFPYLPHRDLGTLAEVQFTIDAKSSEYYDLVVGECFAKKKDIKHAAEHQPSLKAFLDQLDRIGGQFTTHG